MPSNSPPNAVAFLDLEGTKDLAVNNPEQAKQTLREFINLLAQAVKFYTKNVRGYLFSDSVFFEAPLDHADELFELLRVLRLKLLDKQVYFRCSVTVGRLDAQTPKQANPLLTEVSGFVFGAGAVGAYLLHEKLKGIGVTVDLKRFNDELTRASFKKIEQFTTGNAFVQENKQKSGRIEIVGYHDLVWGSDDGQASSLTDDHIFDSLVRNMIQSSLTSPHVAKKFISPIILMTKCADYSDLTTLLSRRSASEQRGQPDEEQSFILHVYKRMFSEKVLEKCSDVPGIHLIYLVFLAQVLSTKKLAVAHDHWVKRIMSMKGCQRLISDRNAPELAIEQSMRQQMAELWAKLS